MNDYPPRESRIGDPPMCDKAWHLGMEPVPATTVLRCSICGLVYARCAACNRGVSSAATSMRAHMKSCYQRRSRRRNIYGERP